MAELPLARPHRGRRVALGELDRVEALADRALHVLRRHVLADADEALSLARIRGLGRDPRETLAGDAAHGLDAVRNLGRHEHAERLVVLDARAGLGEERVRGLPAARGDDEVAADLLAVEDEPSHAALPAPCDELARTRVAHVENLDDVDPDLGELVGDRERLVVRAENDRSLARLDREVADEPAHAVGEHHADEVVPGKHERLLGRARRDDDPLRAEAVEDRAGVDRHETALPDPERARRREHLDPGEREIALARVLVDEDDARTRLRRVERRGAPGLAAADDEHARPAVLRVVAARVSGVRIELPEPGSAAQELLVQRPGGARPDERAVVEADRRERTADLVRHGHEVEVERPADVLPLDDGALADRLGADADVRDAVDGHLAVRAVTRAAEKPARTVVLEGAREHPLARREGGGRDRVALEARHLPPGERERDGLSSGRSARRRGRRASRGLPRLGEHDLEHLVRPRVALGEEPLAAPRAVLPPLALDAGDVVAEVHVLGQLTQASASRTDAW